VILADFVKQKVGDRISQTLPYDLFSEITFLAVSLFNFVSIEEASKAIVDELLKLGITVGTQEITLLRKYPGQERVVPFSKGNPGSLAEPMNSHHADLDLQIGDYVSIAADTWRAKFEGVIKNIRKNLYDVVDFQTGILYENIPHSLISKPVAKGRPIAPPQYRRVGDPLGFMDSPRDSGDTNVTRTWPSTFMPPAGQEGDTVKNPFNPFYSMLDDIEIKSYLKGEKINLSKEATTKLNTLSLFRLP